jgi:hypothetical protein
MIAVPHTGNLTKATLAAIAHSDLHLFGPMKDTKENRNFKLLMNSDVVS